jgi:hypothetical protein
MQGAEIGREPFEGQGRRDAGFPEQPFGGGRRERGPAGGERVVVDQRQPFVPGQDEAGLAEQALRQVGHGAEIGLAHRTEGANRRHATPVQRADQHVGELRPDAGRALGVAVHQADHRGPDDGRRCGRSLGNEVAPDQEPAETLARRGVEGDALSLRESGSKAVNRQILLERLLNDLPGRGHPVPRRGGEDHLIPPFRDGGNGIDRQ